MSKVAVLDTKKAGIRTLCARSVRPTIAPSEGKAAVYKRYPFTIILKREVPNPKTTDYMLSVDPGSKCTGIAITDSESQYHCGV